VVVVVVAAAVAIDDSSVQARRFEIRGPRVKADGDSSTEQHSKCGDQCFWLDFVKAASCALDASFWYFDFHSSNGMP